MSHPLASAGDQAGRLEAGSQPWTHGGRGSWSTARKRGPRRWAAGWSRDAYCVRDPKGSTVPGRGRAHRILGPAHGDRWRELHDARRQVVRALRRSGYLARKAWARAEAGTHRQGRGWVTSHVYEEGPAEGLEAVDPWRAALRLDHCAAGWGVSLRVAEDYGPTVMAMPRRCGATSTCPLCAAFKSAALAEAARQVVRGRRELGQLGAVALVTLTQRAARGESLADALERLRDGWARMTRGRPGRRWRSVVAGAHYGIEVTWDPRRGWHVHMHATIELHETGPAAHAEAQRVVGQLWRDASHAAGVHSSLPDHPQGWGWDPYAGGCLMGDFERVQCPRLDDMRVTDIRAWAAASPVSSANLSGLRRAALVLEVRRRVEAYNRRAARPVLDWAPQPDPDTGEADGWWEVVDTEDDELTEVYQSCKYPTPITELTGLRLAEFLAVAHRRRWHDGVGTLRHVRARAAELVADGVLEEAGVEPGEMPVGESVASVAPGESPTVDQVAPELGWLEPPASVPQLGETVRWRLSAAVTDEHRAALVGVGARIHRERQRERLPDGELVEREILWCHVPRAWVADELRRREREAAERAQRHREAAAARRGPAAVLAAQLEGFVARVAAEARP